jgi:hypothetical protein
LCDCLEKKSTLKHSLQNKHTSFVGKIHATSCFFFIASGKIEFDNHIEVFFHSNTALNTVAKHLKNQVNRIFEQHIKLFNNNNKLFQKNKRLVIYFKT